MKAITLWQPWATLCVEPRPDSAIGRPYKNIETRSWPCPPSLIGQRIAIHAAAREPHYLPQSARPMLVGPSVNGGDRSLWPEGLFGDRASIALPRGVIVGTAVVSECLPMVAERSYDAHILVEPDGLWIAERAFEEDHGQGAIELLQQGWRIDDERPFGDYAPGRFGWVLTGQIQLDEPIPVSGRQRVWNLPESLGYLAEP